MNLMHWRATAFFYTLLGQATLYGIELKWENSGWTIYDFILALLQKLFHWYYLTRFLKFFSDSQDTDYNFAVYFSMTSNIVLEEYGI